jgi:MFS transporter, SP family, solute carrier family 2 (facilitated glucose transporter), member 3
VSIFCIGGLIGAFMGGQLANALGRSGALLLTSGMFLVSGILMFISPNITCLIATRLLVGLASGAATVFVPIYVGEVAPPNLRGTLGAFSQFHLVSVPTYIAYASNMPSFIIRTFQYHFTLAAY